MDGGNAEPARRQAAVEPRALAVSVDDVHALRADHLDGHRQMPHAETAQGQLDHGRAKLAEAIEEDAIPWAGDHDLDLVRGQMPHEIPHVLRPATRARGDEQMQDTNRAAHSADPL